jgi:hypothetical protein
MRAMADARRRPSHRPEMPWPLDELVRAQCLACEGRSYEEIATALGRSIEDVCLQLDPDPAPERAALAAVGYPHLKHR